MKYVACLYGKNCIYGDGVCRFGRPIADDAVKYVYLSCDKLELEEVEAPDSEDKL